MRNLGTFRNVVSSEMLDEVFKRYKNAITGLISSETDSPYTLPLAESEDYENIFTFVQNAVIKDQRLIEGVELNGLDSNDFSKNLIKYFQNSLSESDILNLREFVVNYNKGIADKLYSSAYSYIYGIGPDITLEESFYQRVVILVKQRIELFIQEFLKKNDANRDLSKSVNEWFGISDDLAEVIPVLAPLDPETGDRWFDKDFNTLYIATQNDTWDGATAVILPVAPITNPTEGARWFDETINTLYTYKVNEWYGDDDTPLSSQRSGRAVSLNEFYTSYFLKGNLIEALVSLTIIFYLNNTLKTIDNEFALTDIPNRNLETEANFIAPTTGTQKEYNFTDVKFVVEPVITSNPVFISVDPDNPNIKYYRKVITYTLKPDTNPEILSVPLYSEVIEGSSTDNGVTINETESYISEIYNMVQLDINESISFTDLYRSLYSNLYGFLENIDYINNSLNSDYLQALSYFYNSDQERGALSLSINADIRSAAQMYYLKDFIQQSYYFSTEENEKKSASIDQQSATEKGEHLTFIDLKGISFSEDNLSRARELFTSTDRDYRGAVGRVIGGTELDDDSGDLLKLTYVILYKELTPIYRYYTLSEIQEFIFARMVQQVSKDSIFLGGAGTDTFSASANAIYRVYKEKELSPFVLYDAYNTYRLYYNNIVKTRTAEDSEIIGYFIGDNSELSAFTRNYGAKKYQKEEIYKFLDIYKSTRDYFYKVLRNNSFIFDDAHSLYEKLFISFTAIERFLNSKIDNIHNLDYYNSRDIENFLESYGLGILNQFKFLIDGEDYKINIIKNFAELTRKKGSKDVIDTLLRVFRLQDREIDINKFLLVDKTEADITSSDEYNNIELTLNDADILEVEGTAPIDTNIAGVNDTVLELLQKVLGTEEDPFEPMNIYITIPSLNKYIDPRENIKDYFTQKISLILNENIDAQSANNALLIYKKNLSSFTRIVSLNSTFGNVISDFNIIPDNTGYNLYDINLTDQISKSLTLNSIDPDPVALITETITVDISLIDSVFYAEYGDVRTKIFKIDGTSKSFGEILNDLDLIHVSTNEYNYSLRLLESSPPINAGLLFSSNVVLEDGAEIDLILKKRDVWVVYNNVFNITVKTNIKSGAESLNFVEVSYSSDNGSREISSNLRSGIAYSSFIAPDPYWDEVETSEAQLLTMNINAVETKYLSLALRDNTYKKFAVARYLISAIEHLESKLNIAGATILNNTLLDSGSELFGEISTGDYFKTIKTLFKSIIRLYESKIGNDIVAGVGTENNLFYGINDITLSTSDAAWTELISYLKSILIKGPTDTDAYESFLTLEKLNPNGTTGSIDFFNVYDRVPGNAGWLNYTSQGGEDNNLNISFREIVRDNETGLPKLNLVGDQLRNSLFTSHKTSFGRNLIQSYRDSGEYVINTIKNLNYIRSVGPSEIWLNFLSSYFDGRIITDNELFIQQLFNRTVNTGELYDKIISSLLELPIDIFDGLLTSQLNLNIYHSPKFTELIEKIFNAGYLTTKDPLAVDITLLPQSVKNLIPEAISYLESSENIPNDSNEIDTEIASLTQTLVSMISNMKLLFDSQEYVDFSFSLKNEETQTLDFLTTSISLLLSYTTELYQIEFKRVYDTLSESFPITDDAFHTLRNKRIETVFYDDKLTIERIE
jgi:hypothetical protein